MNRRSLLKLGLVGALFAPRTVLAHGRIDPFASPLAGHLFYTMDAPGRWAGKERGHVPTIERDGATIEVTTGHEMNGYVHYIVKHIILDADLDFVAETRFDPMKDAPVSRHDVSGLTGMVYAVSLCNKHDAWLNAIRL